MGDPVTLLAHWQKAVAKTYHDSGLYAGVRTMADVEKTGDPKFIFLMQLIAPSVFVRSASDAQYVLEGHQRHIDKALMVLCLLP